jgi:hypothetical protein
MHRKRVAIALNHRSEMDKMKYSRRKHLYQRLHFVTNELWSEFTIEHVMIRDCCKAAIRFLLCHYKPINIHNSSIRHSLFVRILPLWHKWCLLLVSCSPRRSFTLQLRINSVSSVDETIVFVSLVCLNVNYFLLGFAGFDFYFFKSNFRKGYGLLLSVWF